MPKKRLTSEGPAQIGTPSGPSVQAETALSFLRDTKGVVTWRVRDLADTLKISSRDAAHVVELLSAQGYVQRASDNEWMTTPAGESVSGAKPPRFARESVEQAVGSLKERIKQVNKDAKAAFRITDAVAFGDFLLKDRVRVQAADVGIGLSRRDNEGGGPRSASDAREERDFLRQLRGRTALLTLRPYWKWMSKRSNLDLL
jgi:hypothetical protein